MGYYIRVLSTSADCLPISTLNAALQDGKFSASLSCEDGNPDAWEQLILSHSDGSEIALIERNLVEEGSLGSEELAEFVDEVSDCKPASAVQWLRDYFRRVRCIYAFQVLNGTEHQNGWEILRAVQSRVWSSVPSILQADLEGFSNEDGYHILWQFSDSVKRLWWMGVLQDGQWKHFQMDLGNKKQRAAFLRGQIPTGVTLL